ncbi:ABC transporter permease subunit [Paenibacillus sp. J5C_2022]|uniref:ABC transporter permease n=1 Tax=Paenibacillus sp. J5C2022 TaxID=2977129 RepID=UPI0021D2635A|nr:ABC transporter permease subunit [Paenibacillus sp. J5C2022]MCU6711362.1 ABC transporter permease subunit [Paenibacillus sp. J5C2022]
MGIQKEALFSVRESKPRYSMKLLLMAIPFITLVFIFYYVPLFGWVYAFFDYKPGIPLEQSNFVGLKYFKIAFMEQGSDLLRVLENSIALSLLNILVSPLYVVFAILLNEMRGKYFRKWVQTTTTLPNFISWVLVYSVFYVFFSVSDGVVNKVLVQIHLLELPFNFLGDSGIAWYFQTIVGLWKGLGWGAIIYLAAIAGIDPELYEAAKVDGAGRFRTIWSITVPGIMPTFVVLLLLNVSNMLNNGFEQFYVFYNALVADKLEVIDYYVYKVGLQSNDFSYSTVLGMFKTVVSVVILFTVNWIARRVRGESII